ncbi:hypothetical protein LTS10_001561 [Elasticomyces elasticus]|nr:hypothetical protein LTS10_001561 [Elasticomyces elasticus]
MNKSTEHLALAEPNALDNRWSVSTSITANGADTNGKDKSAWPPMPPMPPIPTEQEEEAWRRRSTKRQSYTSQMACGTIYKGSQTSLQDPEKSARPPRPPRPFSQISATSTVEISAGRPPRQKQSKPEHDVYGALHWEINARNPRNWTKRKKWAHTLVAAAVTFTITLASSIVAPAREILMADRDVSSTMATLPLALFLLGLTVGPFISRCSCAVTGRKVGYIFFVLLFAIFTLVSGLVNNVHGILVCRAFAGLLAGPALSQGCDMIAEMWTSENRTEALMFYYTSPFIGSVIGVVIGDYVRWHTKYDWTRYVVLFASAACMLPIVLISETSRNVIVRRQHHVSIMRALDEAAVKTALCEPFLMMFSNPMALLLSIQSGYLMAVLYASFLAFPAIFKEAYAFSSGSQGLTFLSMIIGIALAYITLALHHGLVYTPRVEQWQAQRSAEIEKQRRTTARNSHRSVISNFSRPSIRPLPHDSAYTPAQSTVSLSGTIGAARTGTPRAVDTDRTFSLAVAAAKYLNNLDANRKRPITTERIVAILNTNPAFGELCTALEAQKLRFDTIQLAKELADSLPRPSTTESAQQTALARSQSLHRSAAAAILNTPTAEAAPPAVPRLPTYNSRPEVQAQAPGARPPPSWHLWPALPAPVLMAGSLFIFGWTARSTVHWVAPCIGMGLFAFAAYITFVPVQLYLSDRYGSSALAGDMTVRYLLSFAFAMLALPLYDRLGVRWGSSVLGLAGLLLGATQWVLVFAGRKRRKGRLGDDAL